MNEAKSATVETGRGNEPETEEPVSDVLTLTPRDWEAFLDGLDRAAEPRPRLEAAARRYLARRGRAEAEGES